MAVQSVSDITNSILTQLQTSDPSVSAEVGTPERELIEAVAEIIASAQVDFSVLDSQSDIDTMTGSRLDSYLSLFAFQRQQAIAATGTVTFACTAPATADIVIPVGTPVQATASDPSFPNVTFNTTLTVTLPQGGTSVDAPVQAALPGTIGNVSALSVTGFGSIKTIIGITSITNAAAMSGGADPEDDDDFRTRFKNGIFRNMAGTSDQFLALAVSQPNVSKATVLGPVSRYQEYVQVPFVDDAEMDTASGDDKNYDPGGTNFTHKRTTAASSNPYSQYTYNTQFYLSDGNGNFFRPDVDYVFNRKAIDPANATSSHRHFLAAAVTAHDPNITILGYGSSVFPTGLAPGTVVLLEHAYISANSRNNLPSGILNAVDVFVNGQNETSAKSAEVMPGSGNILQNTASNAWTYQNSPTINFIVNLSGANAAVGNKVLPLYWQPVLSMPPKVSIKHSNGTTYTLYGGRFYEASGPQYYYDDPNGTYTPAQVSAGYPRVANYVQVYESNSNRGTIRARDGIEFRSTVNVRKPAEDGSTESFSAVDTGFVGSQFVGSLAYTYDANPGAIQAIMEQNKQITTDVLVHAAATRYFKLNITLMYTPGATQSVVNAAVAATVAGYFENQYFGATIQLSDLTNIIANTPGVDNVRFTANALPPNTIWQASHAYSIGTFVRPTSANANGYIFVATANTGDTHSGSTEPVWDTSGASITDNHVTWQAYVPFHRIEEVFPDGTSFSPQVFFDQDFYLQDNQLADSPANNAVVIQVRAPNTWNS